MREDPRLCRREVQRTSVVKDEINNKVYLTSVVTLPVAAKGTETWVFEMTSTGFAFVGVREGNASNTQNSPAADYWAKYTGKIN